MTLKAPFPYFGGKSRVAAQVWARLGDVPNYVEPFFGSGAMLLARPHTPRIETVNDADGFLANFWRAVQHDPGAVAQWTDWPVNEADLYARHVWLVKQGAALMQLLESDPDAYDAKIAGWWVWGLCAWIGSGWCATAATSEWRKLPHLGDAGRGVHRQRPHLGNAGVGVHRPSAAVGDAGRGDDNLSLDALMSMFRELQRRLRRVRVCCGDWKRVLGPSPTTKLGVTAVFLDPPYSHEERYASLYAVESATVAAEVREWAIAHGDDPFMRIALCGYDTEHEMPPTWEAVRWKSLGGYGSLGNNRGRDNAARETVWFSPHCLKPTESLFAWSDNQETP